MEPVICVPAIIAIGNRTNRDRFIMIKSYSCDRDGLSVSAIGLEYYLYDNNEVRSVAITFEQARKDYQQALKIFIEFDDRYSQASTYHQLGIVAEELREYEQARKDYQQALEIQIEYNDRYSQAGTYHQLGSVAQNLREYEESGSNYLKALQLYVEYNDQHNLGIVFRSCKRLYQLHSSDQLLSAIGQAIPVPGGFANGCSEAEVLQLFEQL